MGQMRLEKQDMFMNSMVEYMFLEKVPYLVGDGKNFTDFDLKLLQVVRLQSMRCLQSMRWYSIWPRIKMRR